MFLNPCFRPPLIYILPLMVLNHYHKFSELQLISCDRTGTYTSLSSEITVAFLCTFYTNLNILGAFSKLQKETVSFAISVCPSAWNDAAPLNGFSMYFIFGYFSKICR